MDGRFEMECFANLPQHGAATETGKTAGYREWVLVILILITPLCGLVVADDNRSFCVILRFTFDRAQL